MLYGLSSSPVSGTTTQKSLENQSFRPQSRSDCSPRVSPKTFLGHGLSHSDCTGSGEANCSPEVSPNGLPCGVWRRGAVYQYRTRVPADLIAIVGKPRINRSLKTASLAVARRSVRATAYDIERQFEALRQVDGAAAMQDRIVVADRPHRLCRCVETSVSIVQPKSAHPAPNRRERQSR